MATEVCSASPRISFSGNIISAGGESQRRDGSLPLETGVGDFKFSVSFQSAINDSSDADELFSDGKILPFFKTPGMAENNPGPAPPPPPPLIFDQRGSLREPGIRSGENDARAAFYRRGSGRHSIWRFGRSSSVGSGAPPGPILPLPLHRSRSTGSSLHPSRRQPQPAANMNWSVKSPADLSQRKTYYYSGSQAGSHRGSVRITPVLNVPAPIISRSGSSSSCSSATISSLFAYLLCSCGGEQRRGEVDEIRLHYNGIERTALNGPLNSLSLRSGTKGHS